MFQHLPQDGPCMVHLSTSQWDIHVNIIHKNSFLYVHESELQLCQNSICGTSLDVPMIQKSFCMILPGSVSKSQLSFVMKSPRPFQPISISYCSLFDIPLFFTSGFKVERFNQIFDTKWHCITDTKGRLFGTSTKYTVCPRTLPFDRKYTDWENTIHLGIYMATCLLNQQ